MSNPTRRDQEIAWDRGYISTLEKICSLGGNPNDTAREHMFNFVDWKMDSEELNDFWQRWKLCGGNIQMYFRDDGGERKTLLEHAIRKAPENEHGTEIIKSLCRNGASIEAGSLDDDGASPFLVALSLGKTTFARTLLEAGANPFIRTDDGVDAWAFICRSSNIKDTATAREIADLLDNADLPPTQVSGGTYQALKYAMNEENPTFMRLVLERLPKDETVKMALEEFIDDQGYLLKMPDRKVKPEEQECLSIAQQHLLAMKHEDTTPQRKHSAGI